MVKPEARCNPATLALAQFGGVMRMRLGCFEAFDKTNAIPSRAIGRLGAFARCVFQACLNRIETKHIAQLIDNRFHGKGSHRRARRTISGLLRTVGHDLVSLNRNCIEVVRRIGAFSGHSSRCIRKRAALKAENTLGCGHLAVIGHADLDVHRRRRRRTSGAQDLRPAHHDLHRTIGFARKRKRNGFDKHRGFASKTTTDFRGRHAKLACIHAKQSRAGFLSDEMPLGTAPQFAFAIVPQCRQRGVWFDVALVGRFGGERAFDHQIRLREPLFKIAVPAFVVVYDVGMHSFWNELGLLAFAYHRRIRLHRFIDVDYMRQDFILDFDQLSRITSNQ